MFKKEGSSVNPFATLPRLREGRKIIGEAENTQRLKSDVSSTFENKQNIDSDICKVPHLSFSPPALRFHHRESPAQLHAHRLPEIGQITNAA